MGIIKEGGRAARLLNKLKPGRKSAFVAGSTLAGGFVSYENAQPGLKHQASKEGAMSGLTAGLALAATPFIGRNLAKGFKATTVKPIVNRARALGRVAFRRIRGRIVPVRVK